MSDLFQVGEAYRNRLGEFTVLDVSDDEVSIRYDDGTEMTVDRELQRRIVRNIRFEKRVAQQIKLTKGSSRGSRTLVPASWGRDWHGLLETDFQDSSAGTHWRNRGELGGAVAREISEKIAKRFESYACYRQSECHLYDPAIYDDDVRDRQAKFVIDLSDVGARIAFHLQRNDRPLDESWDWTRLSAALQKDASLGIRTEQAMRRHELTWFVCDEEKSEPLATVMAAAEPGQFIFSQGQETSVMALAELPQIMDRLDVQWRKLYLGKQLPREDALALGASLSTHATAIMVDLMPLYRASTSAE